jgi:enoyl-CoA hydratase/carnithine racemase
VDIPLVFEVQNGVGWIRLNRPERLNALSADMLGAWEQCLHECRKRNDVGAVVVTGAGRGFCSGMDLKATPETDDDRAFPLRDSVHRVAKAVHDLDRPYIAAINGVAAGAGMDMASMADVRFMAKSATLLMSYVKLGLVPGDGGCYYLPRIVGMQKALDLMWTGRPMHSSEALESGYCLRVVDDADLETAVLEYAENLAAGPRIAIQLIRRLCLGTHSTDVASALELTEMAFIVARGSSDAREGIAAARDGRAALFNRPRK